MMYKSLGGLLELTGGYAYNINNINEDPHCTVKRAVCAMFMGAHIPDTYWCFAGKYAAHVYNNYVNRNTGRPHALGYANKLVPVSPNFPIQLLRENHQ